MNLLLSFWYYVDPLFQVQIPVFILSTHIQMLNHGLCRPSQTPNNLMRLFSLGSTTGFRKTLISKLYLLPLVLPYLYKRHERGALHTPNYILIRYINHLSYFQPNLTFQGLKTIFNQSVEHLILNSCLKRIKETRS